jgi:hypothetical protein
MTPTVRLALALLPLAAYFAVLGAWYAGRRPRVVAGPLDFGFLAFGLGGVIAFGPVGGLVVNAVFPHPNVSAWLAIASLVGLLAMFWAARTKARLVIYHVDGEALKDAVRLAMEGIAGPVMSTVHGFEDATHRRGLRVEIGRSLGYGVIEAYGERPEVLIEAIRSALGPRLDAKVANRARLAAVWFALAGGTFTLLLVVLFLMSRAELHAVRKAAG